MLAHWLFRWWENCSKLSGHALWKFSKKFHVLFVDRIVVGEIPVFLANLLDGKVLFVLEKRNVCPLLFTQKARKKPCLENEFRKRSWLTPPNQVRHTNWFSCHKRLCFLSFCINYLLFFEMYYIYKEQVLFGCVKGCKSPFAVKYVYKVLRVFLGRIFARTKQKHANKKHFREAVLCTKFHAKPSSHRKKRPHTRFFASPSFFKTVIFRNSRTTRANCYIFAGSSGMKGSKKCEK